MRPSQRPLSVRNLLASPTDRQTPTYTPAARLVGGGGGSGRGAVEVANQLQHLLGNGAIVATNVIVQRNEKFQKQGRADAASGVVDPELAARNKAYAAGSDAFRLELELANSQGEFENLLRDSGFDPMSGDVEGLRKLGDQYFEQKWGAEVAKNPSYKEEIALAHADMVGATADKLATERAQAQAQDDVATVSILMDTQIAEGKLDAAALEETDKRLVSMFGPADARVIMTRLLANKAIELGRPDLIDLLPSTWENGAATSKGVPELALELRNAKIAAQRAKDSQEAEAGRQRETARNEARAQARNEIASAIIDGQSGIGLSKAKELLDAGVLDFEDYRALNNFAEDLVVDTGGGSDEGSVEALDMEVRLRTGEADLEDLMKSPLSVKEKRRLLPLAGKKDDGRSRNYRSDLRLRSTPPRALGGEVRAADIQRQADLLAEYDELIDGGSTPQAAYAEMKRRNPDLFGAQSQPAVPFNPDTSPDVRSGPSSRGRRPQGAPVPTPKTQAEYDALPSGTVYVDTDGVTKRKR